MPNDPINLPVEPPEVEVEEAEEGDAIDDLPNLSDSGTSTLPEPEPLHSFGVDAKYVWDHGVCTAPKAGPKGTAQAVWRAHGGSCKLVVTWQAVAVGSWPKVPHPAALIDNELLIGQEVAYGEPKPGFGRLYHTICGVYTYALRVAPGEDDHLRGITSPLIRVNRPAALNSIRVAEFDRSLMASFNPSGASLPTLPPGITG